MNKHLVIFILFTFYFFSCNNETAEEKIAGSYNLQSILATCTSADLSEATELIATNNTGCTIVNPDSKVSIFNTEFCSTIVLNVDGTGFIVGQLDQTEIIHEIISEGDSLQVCVPTNPFGCVQYSIGQNMLTQDLEITTITGLPCSTVLFYEKL